VPPSVGQRDDSEVFSNIVLGYINLMLMVEDIDGKFEHYLEHLVLLNELVATSSLSHLQEYVSSVSEVCCKCCISMLQK
jgi:hypothetical protein